ncbi:phospholipid-binding protein MlaC [Vibrio hepatarius]|uniref:phospholipid-binding protein MlaC n=1 Tax=Vibrio hepatarius TaxID=171383 RepID=UPI001C08FA17|nr:phospholipid-binding protein MlaC [Vibrio hepatarius]MBU2897138.1 phospholipid-binding protein MlaC [Vibrio hepatarius]
MFKKLVIAVAVFAMALTASAAEIDKTQPYQMMKQVSQQAFNRLKLEQDKVHNNPEYLKVIVEEELMPYVNEKYAALKLLGPNLKGAKREDVGKFIVSFRAYLVSSYAQVLTQYTNQEIKFGPESKIDPSKTITGVKVDIIDSPRPNIKLEFKLRKDKKTGEWQAFDIIAEGISLLSSKQSEWSSQLRQDGILVVAKDLEDLAARPIRFESKEK